jgi:hypothetical protein
MSPSLDLTPLSPFNYGSLSTLLIYWQVPPPAVEGLVAANAVGLQPAVFGGRSLVCLNFERYSSLGANFAGITVETEFNIVVRPADGAGILPTLTVDQFLAGCDEAKVYGNFRVNVPCTDPVAVQHGSQDYGEIKFLTGYNYQVPGVNAPTVADWWIRCRDPKTPTSDTPFIFDLHANFQGTRPQVSNFSPVVAYANLKKPDGPHLVLSGRNVFGPFLRWTPGPDTVQLQIGTSDHPMVAQMKTAFAGAEPVGILLFESQPAATSTHALVTTPVAVEGV